MHSAKYLLPIPLRPLVPVQVKDQSVEYFGLRFHIQSMFHSIGTFNVRIVLPAPLVEGEVLIKSLSKESLAHPHACSMELALLSVPHITDALPPRHGHTQSPVIEFANSLVH